MTAPPGPSGTNQIGIRTRRRPVAPGTASRSAHLRGTPYRGIAVLGALALGLALVLVVPVGAVSDSAFHLSSRPTTLATAGTHALDLGSNNSSGSDDGSGDGSGGSYSGGNGSGTVGANSTANGTGGNTSGSGGGSDSGAGSNGSASSSDGTNGSSSDGSGGPSAGGNQSLPTAGASGPLGGGGSLSLGTVGVPAVLVVLGLIGAIVIATDLRARRRRPPSAKAGA